MKSTTKKKRVKVKRNLLDKKLETVIVRRFAKMGKRELERELLKNRDDEKKLKRQSDRNLIVTEARARQNHETDTEKRKKEKIATRKKILKKLFMLRRYESRL